MAAVRFAADFPAAVVLTAVFLAAAFSAGAFPLPDVPAAVFFTAAFFAVLFPAAAFSTTAVPAAVVADVPAAGADRFAAEVFLAAVFFTAAFLATVFLATALLADASPAAVFPAAVLLAAVRFFPCVPPAAASAAVDVADAGFLSAVFFATMAAAPSHIVILLANRAGTINRHQPRGKRATPPLRPPRPR